MTEESVPAHLREPIWLDVILLCITFPIWIVLAACREYCLQRGIKP